MGYAERNAGTGTLSSDPDYSKQWYLDNVGQTGGTSGADIKAEEAWQITTGSSSTVIAILDNGVELSHEDLVGRVTGDGPDSFGDNHIDHGTRIAGIIGAIADNGKGGRGINWRAQIISRRTADGSGNALLAVTIANAIVDAVNSGADILNCSWDYETATTHEAFAYAYEMGSLVVAAMGNGGGSHADCPASYGSGVIAVGSTLDNDTRASYSNTGGWIDVVAPGGTHLLTPFDQHDIWTTKTGNSYSYDGGTSMAAPVVAGVASLVMGNNTNLSSDDVEHIIRLSADKVHPETYVYDSDGWNIQMGYGRVNARRALDLVRAPYVLSHYSAAGGTDVGASDWRYISIFGQGLAGMYVVKRHEVQKSVAFPATNGIHVWGRGDATTGWSIDDFNYSNGWCDIIPGTVTSTSATLRTYIYEVRTLAGIPLGWYPTSPANVVYAYTVHGQPVPPLSAIISGPHALSFKQQGTWTAMTSGGSGNVTYQWYVSSNGGSTWTALQTARTQSYTMVYTTLIMRCDVHYNGTGENASARLTVNYGTIEPNVAPGPDGADPINLTIIPGNNSLDQNYPNPFNPSTQIHFGLSKPAHVRLLVYDVLGRQVAKLVDEQMAAGYHLVTWNASNVSSGIYVYRVTAGDYVQTRRMLLMK